MLHVCFDKVNNDLTYETISQYTTLDLYLESSCGHTHHKLRGEIGYVLKLNKPIQIGYTQKFQ